MNVVMRMSDRSVMMIMIIIRIVLTTMHFITPFIFPFLCPYYSSPGTRGKKREGKKREEKKITEKKREWRGIKTRCVRHYGITNTTTFTECYNTASITSQ